MARGDEDERDVLKRQIDDVLWGPAGADPSIPAADLAALQAASEKIKSYVDQHVAHDDASPVPADVTLTLKEVHDVIDVIGHLFRKYCNLLTANSYETLVPVIGHDWKAIFRESWISPGND